MPLGSGLMANVVLIEGSGMFDRRSTRGVFTEGSGAKDRSFKVRCVTEHCRWSVHGMEGMGRCCRSLTGRHTPETSILHAACGKHTAKQQLT
jgi:hypothetical protein